MNDVFQEVNQSLREENLAKWWRRWSFFVYAGIAAVIIAVGAWEFMRFQRTEAISKAAKTYDAGFVALEARDLATARARFSELARNDAGFAVLADHMLAGVERDLTNDPAAIEAHLKAAAAADKGVMGDLALLKLGYLKADTATVEELEVSMKPLIDRGGQAALLAQELIAAKLLASGNVERARDMFEVLGADTSAPRAMQQRVSQALATLPARTINLDAPAAPAAPPPAPATNEASPQPAAPAPATQPGQPQQ